VLDANIVLVGYSGHGLVVADSIKSLDSFKLMGYIDHQSKDFNPFDLTYLGSETPETFSKIRKNQFQVILGIGDNYIRKKVFNLYQSENIPFINVVDPSSIISNYAEFGIGNFISKNAIVNSFSKIADNCILNTGCIIEHECIIDSHVHIAPGTVLCGNVRIGESTFVGANSVVKQGITIGKNVIIGAGSVVLKNIPDNEVWVGNPAKKRSNGK
jgi:sugar O-acyltransferase (sialic acid O-acetyltransferase NeuD family)